jgi:hypothetical protein
VTQLVLDKVSFVQLFVNLSFWIKGKFVSY